MYVVWGLIGLVVFGLLGQSVLGAALGAALGVLWARQSALRRDLNEAYRRLERAMQAPPAQAPVESVAPPSVQVAAPPATPPPVAQAPAAEAAAQPPVPPVPEPASARPAIAPVPRSKPHSPSPLDQAATWLKRWLTEGNVPVKIGMLVLFAGVAALLKYASDSGLLRLPISLRLATVALAAIAALGFAWRQRSVRRVFALSLQGGAIGVLVIDVFAAFRLYHLLPAPAAFALLLVLVAGVGLLAVLQDALALAVLGLLAGFLAPILTSTGHGSHVALFSYYAVLNLAILGIAWKRAWRVLNLLGFVATYGIATAWGVLQYHTELFASTEPFLVLNFLFYLAIPLLYLLRTPGDRQRVVDGCLLFSNPLISLLLQGALLDWHGRPMALSALAMAAVYLGVAWAIRQRLALGLLRDAWAVLAVAFATLAVPLGLSASLTSSVFALEGAGLIWLGLRQQRALARWGGLGLQALALLSLLASGIDAVDTRLSWLDQHALNALLLAVGAFAGSTFYARLGGAVMSSRLAALLLYGWGMCCWLGASALEIDRHVLLSAEAAAFLVLFGVTAWVCAELARRKPPHELGQALAFSVPLLFAAQLLALLWGWQAGQQPLWGWSVLGVLLAGVLGWRSLLDLRGQTAAALPAQLAWLWRWLLIVASALALGFADSRWMADSWRLLLALAPACVLCWLALLRPRLVAAPLPEQARGLQMPLLYSLLAVLGAAWLVGLFLDGDAAPLRYLPLLNPLELILLAVLACTARWLGDTAAPEPLRARRALVLGGLGIAFVTSATLRAVHQLGGVPWSDALSESSLAQMSLTVVWSVFGLLAWVWGSRRGQREIWLAGAVAMAVVLAKLLLIDRSHLGNLFGIASFIAYGLLCTLIGYLAPAPPRRPSSPLPETTDAP